MRIGLIGHPLGHSWSKALHQFFLKEDYFLWDIEELDSFMKKKDFDGINVTIPYKEKVIPYLDEIDESAKEIGAVNCITNRSGILKGYNTDYLGFKELLHHEGIDVKGKEVLILGSGGVSKAIQSVVKSLEGIPVVVSRNPRENQIGYEDVSKGKYRIIVNATPVGMYPNMDEMPIAFEEIPDAEVLVDAIANPICTKWLCEGQRRGLKTAGGLRMLVAQAFYADQYFTHQEMDYHLIEDCYRAVLKKNANIVLIGMPTCGKSSIGEQLGKRYERPWIDMDHEGDQRIGIPIQEYIEEKGEKAFRDLEAEIAKDLSKESGLVISTGGGVVTREDTMFYLKRNGICIFIDRALEDLVPSSDRPLSKTKEDLERMYKERYSLYQNYADDVVRNEGDIEEVIQEIEKRWEGVL